MVRGLRAPTASVLAALLLALGPTACGGDDDGPVKSGSETLTVYSSLPLQGPERPRVRDMVNAMKLALQEVGGKVGPFSINYVSLDSATREAGTWTGDRVLDNARSALRDLNTIAYIGERDSEATALSLPLTNEGNILQVSPSSGYDGLTRASRRQGEPERFYPTGRRTFGRVVPADHVQASALVGYMKSQGVRRVAMVADRDLFGSGLAGNVERAASGQGVEVIDAGLIDATSGDLAGRTKKIAATGADAFLFAGSVDDGAARIFSAVGAARPKMLLFGPGQAVDASLARSLRESVRKRVRITSPLLPPRLLPASARAFRASFRTAFGRLPVPEALQAYAAVRAVLLSIRSAGEKGNDREAVRRAFYEIDDQPSVLGTYSIDERGDTSLSRYAGNRLSTSGQVLDKVLDVRG